MNFTPSKHPSRITIPQHAHPAARLLFAQMREQRCSIWEMEAASGVLASTIKAWRVAKTPGLTTIQATLGVLGWDLVPVPRPEHLPPGLVAELQEMADRWADHLEHIHPAMIAMAARAHETWTPARSSEQPRDLAA